ncbi:MAG: hypothetical protein V7L26_12120 [Nostoc sp.]|uniref:hypothetical protein n=1 Tax=Nostoc sp. TaxID=1180 RepID=UPI002FF0FD69
MKISEYPVITTLSDNDLLLIETASDGAYKSISNSNLKAEVSGNGSGSAYIQLTDTRASGVVGGTATFASWTTRPINNIDHDDTSAVTLVSNEFVLPSGIYQIEATVAFYGLFDTKLRLQNVTDATTILYGINAQFNPSAGFVGHSHLFGKFTVTANKSLALQYYTVSGGSSSQYNYGGSVGDGSPEKYASIDIWKVG